MTEGVTLSEMIRALSLCTSAVASLGFLAFPIFLPVVGDRGMLCGKLCTIGRELLLLWWR